MEDNGDLLGVIQLHADLNAFDGSHLRQAGDRCNTCTLQHGTFIKPDFSFGDRTLPDFSNRTLSICSAGNQCVGTQEAETGCCQPCKNDQVCVQATISFNGIGSAGSWNKCPPGYVCNSFAKVLPNVIKKCEAGTICESSSQQSCRVLRQKAIDEGYGDIHAGSYCPEGEFRLIYCPQGYYCNSTDMTKKFICPAGMFCPLKTEVPEIECPGCKEGATELRTDPVIATAFGIPLLLLLLLTLLVRVYRLKSISRRIKCCHELDEITYEPKHETAAKAEIQAMRMSVLVHGSKISFDARRTNIDELRIFNMIASIKNRVAKISDSSSGGLSKDSDIESKESDVEEEPLDQSIVGRVLSFTSSFFNSEEKENEIMFENLPPTEDEEASKKLLCSDSYMSLASMDFDAELVFNKLDTDKDGLLDYEELNDLLKLSEVKLKYFVRRMNKLEGVPLDTTTISRQCFLNHFYDTLVNTDTFDPDSNEAAEIFNALDTNNNGVIEGIELYTPLLSAFLTDRQINVMMKKMKKKDDKGTESIDKETFLELYPLLLSDLILSSPVEPGLTVPGVDITFSDLSLTVTVSGKPLNIINSIGGRIREKTMTAIMGGSGTGKTSLLNSLCGKAFYGKVSGNVLINGRKARMEDHKHLMGFVPQDDIMYAELTVRENLIYAGRFKLPPSTPLEEIKELADDVIVNLGLIRVRDRVVGSVRRRGISGGEKKRVNIGLELMGKPRILFLDEPTSGLDASSSSLVMASLKSLVRDDGVTCVSVIHQPRKFIFDLIDNVILLGVGGRIAYHGSPKESISHFEQIGYELPTGENVADWLLDISSGQLGKPGNNDTSTTGLPTGEHLQEAREFLFERWEDHVLSLPEEDMEISLLPPIPFEIPPSPEKPPFSSQLISQIRRNFLVMNRNRLSIVIDCFIIVLSVIIIAAIDGKSILVDTRFIKNPEGVPLSKSSNARLLPLRTMLWPFARAAIDYQGDAIKIAVICSVLVGLNATKVMSEKKVEFFRETSSGYNINAYFVAVNITSFIEHSVQMILAGFVTVLFRSTISSWWATFLNFVMLGWGCVSWSLLFSVIIPPKNLVIVTGFFMSFFSILLGGAIPPFDFEEIYNSKFLQLLCGFFSPARFFIETFIVSDFKCLPEQTGFTLQSDTPDTRMTSFDLAMLAVNDENVTEKSCNGWFYYYPACLFTGLTIRIAAGILLHLANRSELNQTSLKRALRQKQFLLRTMILVFFFLCMCSLSVFLIIK